MSPRHLLPFLSLVVALVVPTSAPAANPGRTCERVASQGLRSCVRKVAGQQQRCYQATGSPCLATHPKVVAALAAVDAKVLGKCPDQATLSAAFYGPALTPSGLAERLREACAGAVASLAARSYGGPHGAARAAATEVDRDCLDQAWAEGWSLIDYALRQQSACVRKVHRGGVCSDATVAARVAARETSTAADIVSHCPAALETLVAIEASAFVARATAQARCLVAVAHGDTGPLVLDCGPRPAVPVPPRGTPTQVVLPSAMWGTRCGDGSDYAFWLQLAPAGADVGKVVVYMQGGGACYTEATCASQPPGLFEALGDPMPQGGILSSTASTNPFRDWTKVYLPYCNQDLHIGGGVTNVYPSITIHRYGGLNVRAAMRWVRDVLWAEMDASDPEGYRGDRVLTLFSGGSAGGYGAAYNYHWVLDDLGWPHTSSAPDAALGMDNGGVGVIVLGAVVLAPGFWNTRPLMPPYCFISTCQEIFVNLEAATAPRLLGVPEQQFLDVTNQIDGVQQATTLFGSTPAFVNTLRASYCAIQGTPGLHSFLRGSSTSIHTQLTGNAFNTATIGGTLLRDWLGDAMTMPAAVIDKTQDGTLQTDHPGVAPFPCTVGSPSGAFLDDGLPG